MPGRTTGALAFYGSEGDQEAVPHSRTATDLHKFWQKEKSAAQKRLSKWQKQGNQVVRRFLDERDGKNDSQYYEGYRGDTPSKLNLFHTNIVTLQSMLYGSTPKIEVSREHQDPDDDIARVASTLYQRILEADVQSSGDDLSTTLKAALQDRLLPGLGCARVRYDYESETRNVLNFETMDVTPTEMLTGEFASIEYVHWQDFIWGWGRTWSEIPWIAYRSWMTKEEATKRFSKKKAAALEYKNQLPTGVENKDETYDKDQKNNIQKAEIWEFWHRVEKRVYWYSDGAELILDTEKDPLRLDGFFPSPMPLMANLTTTIFVPRADFVMAQDLYNEIDSLMSRISTITRACKVVGVYDESAGNSVGRMLKEGVENDLIPVPNWAMFAEKGGLDGTIDWFPVQEVAGTLSILRSLLGETIELLYQVTGMSDILRGANTDQYTSDGTNQLKAKFGSIRVQALQDQFSKFASDLDAIKAEIISKHFQPESISKQSNAQFMPEADLDKVPDAIALMKAPDVKWRIDIRPESLAMVDYAQLKSERTEFLMGMATFIQSASAAVATVPDAMPIMLELMKWGMAGFKGSSYLEGTFDRAIDMAKKAPPPGGEDDKKKEEADQAKHQAAMELLQAKTQAAMELQQSKAQAEMQRNQQDHQSKMEQQQAKNQGDMQKLMADLHADLKVISAKLNADIQGEQAQAVGAAAEQQVGHEHTLIEQEQDHANTMKEIGESGKVAARQSDGQAGTD